MKATAFEKWLIRRWIRKGLLYQPIEGGTNFPGGPIQTGGAFLYETPALALPQTTNKILFRAAGLQYQGAPASLEILDIFGVVVVAIGAVANATKLGALCTDDTGANLTAVDLCATLDVNGLAIGTSLSITGTLTDAMTNNANGVQIAQVTPIHLTFGTFANVRVTCAGSDGGTGRVKWFMLARTSYGVVVTPQAS